MVPMNPIVEQRNMLARINQMFTDLKKINFNEVDNLSSASSCLRDMRIAHYEDINQLQHAIMILDAWEFLKKSNKYESFEILQWFWNPHQTGGGEEPDLRGMLNGVTVISAEITTSESPVGTIDVRMSSTLKKLNKMEGKYLYYFVRTDKMRKRALTKLSKFEKTSIKVVNLLDGNAENQIE